MLFGKCSCGRSLEHIDDDFCVICDNHYKAKKEILTLAVVGSRTITSRMYVWSILDVIHTLTPISKIVSGGAKGIDSLAAEWAKRNQIPVEEILADWDKYGKAAGYKRNPDIIKAATKVLVIWDGVSNGTKNSLEIAQKENKLLKLINLKDYTK